MSDKPMTGKDFSDALINRPNDDKDDTIATLSRELAEAKSRASLFAEELEHDNSDYCKRADKAEGELSRLRANFDRIVTAWKREELSWDEERKDLNRDVKQLHDAAVETEGKLEALTQERDVLADVADGALKLREKVEQERDDLLAYYEAVKAWWELHDSEVLDIVARIESRRSK